MIFSQQSGIQVYPLPPTVSVFYQMGVGHINFQVPECRACLFSAESNHYFLPTSPKFAFASTLVLAFLSNQSQPEMWKVVLLPLILPNI